MPDPRCTKDSSGFSVVGERVAAIESNHLWVASLSGKHMFLGSACARDYCEAVAEWFGGTVTWACSETSDSGEEIGGNGTAAKPELEAAGGAPKITPKHAEFGECDGCGGAVPTGGLCQRCVPVASEIVIDAELSEALAAKRNHPEWREAAR